MGSSANFDVLIVGAGITGLATAHFLRGHGIKKLAVVSMPGSETINCAGISQAGQWDNYTRFCHAHGRSFSKAFWRFGHLGWKALSSYCLEKEIRQILASRLRLGTSELEKEEALKACGMLSEDAFHAELKVTQEFGESWVQDEGQTATLINPHDVLESLRHECNLIKAKVTGIKSQSQEMQVLTDRKSYSCEMVVLAGHLQIAKLVQHLDPILIPYADQWLEARIKNPCESPIVFSMQHGHIWGAIWGDRLIVGGARFIRPMAGIGTYQPSFSGKVSRFLSKAMREVFPAQPFGSWQRGSIGIECRPCDELPIIGPLAGEPRVLMASGYSGSGLSLGYMAGKSLASLICNGKCDLLPRRLWPERLRTLEA